MKINIIQPTTKKPKFKDLEIGDTFFGFGRQHKNCLHLKIEKITTNKDDYFDDITDICLKNNNGCISRDNEEIIPVKAVVNQDK